MPHSGGLPGRAAEPGGQRAEPVKVVHKQTMLKAVLAAPPVGLGVISPFSKFTHFHSVNINSMCCQSFNREGCMTVVYCGGLWEGKF